MNWVIFNFDLGLKGDYESLYRFLDNHKAMDCGNSNCVFEYNFSKKDLSHDEKFKELEIYLESIMNLNSGDRIYCIVHNSKGTPRGSFIFGRRKTPAWEGYGDKQENSGLPF